MNPAPAAVLSPMIDFFGYHIDRSIVSDHVTTAIAAAQNGIAGEPFLLGKVDELLLGTNSLAGFMSDFAGRFGQAVSLSSPSLVSDLVQRFLPSTVGGRTGPDLGPALQPLGYLFDRVHLLPVPLLGNKISLSEVRFLGVLPRLANLDWGHANGDPVALRGRLQQLRIYFVEFFHGRFKDRNGDTITPSGKLDLIHISPELAGQLVRVLIEFVGDAAFRVPAYVPKGTTTPPDSPITCEKAVVITDELPAQVVTGDPAGTDYHDLVGEIIDYAGTHAEMATHAEIGGVIRGGGLAGINNEVVAEAIASAVGGIAKKVAEKIAYEVLTRFIADPNIGPDAKIVILKVLDYLHKNGPKPPNFPI